jgi:hypothetical protein
MELTMFTIFEEEEEECYDGDDKMLLKSNSG